MNQNTRACVAFAAAALINGQTGGSVYDYLNSKHISIAGSVSTSQVNIYDYDRGCHFSGSPPSLYDYGRSCHVTLEINGNNFSGYDYGDSHHFSGTVNGNSVSLYDNGELSHFSYSV